MKKRIVSIISAITIGVSLFSQMPPLIVKASDEQFIKQMEEKLDNIFEAVNTKAIVNKAIEKFKTMPSKSIAAFKSTVNTIVHTMANTDREEDVIVESKNLLALSFHFFIIVGATAVSPWIGIAAFIASTLTRIHLTRESTKKALSIWY